MIEILAELIMAIVNNWFEMREEKSAMRIFENILRENKLGFRIKCIFQNIWSKVKIIFNKFCEIKLFNKVFMHEKNYLFRNYLCCI